MLWYHKSLYRSGEYTKGSLVAKNELHTGNIEWVIHFQTSSFSPSYSPLSVMCESLYPRIGLASQGKPHMLQNCWMKIYFDLTNLGAKNELHTGNIQWLIHFQTSSFSPSYYPRSVISESLYTRIGLASQVKTHILQNFCMKIYFDLTNLGTDMESTPRAPPSPKMSFLLGILNDLFTCKLHLSLPATTRGPLYASHCIQE